MRACNGPALSRNLCTAWLGNIFRTQPCHHDDKLNHVTFSVLHYQKKWKWQEMAGQKFDRKGGLTDLPFQKCV